MTARFSQKGKNKKDKSMNNILLAPVNRANHLEKKPFGKKLNK